MDEPPITGADAFYLKAFGELNTCRSSGFDIGAIPWTAIIQYGLHAGLDHDMLDTLVLVIRKMDEPYREWQKAEVERRAKAQKDSLPKPTRTTAAKG